MIYIDSPSTSPYFNLALEQYVFEELDRSQDYFMLWQNDNTIVVGKYQNTIGEIDAQFVKEHCINVVRRLSGGGAVYHDLGNLNFTFITTQTEDGFDFGRFCAPVIKALADLGVKAELSGRNDMLIDGRKFSGNAQYLKHGRVMHHGTILFDSDLTVLTKALQVSKDKIESKGIQSVRSRVTNVKEHLPTDIDLAAFRKKLAESILAGAGASQYELTEPDLVRVEAIRQEVYARWEWNYGASPQCDLVRERRIEGCGKVAAYITLVKGCIENVEFRGDYFGGEPTALVEQLIGCRLDEEALLKALEGLQASEFFNGLTNRQLAEMIAGVDQ